MGIENLKESLIDSVSGVSDKLKNSFSVLTDIKEAGNEKLAAMMNEVISLTPLISQAGFDIHDLNINITIPPNVTLNFIKKNEIDRESIDKLLKENEDKEMLKLIVQTLVKADNLQQSLNLTNYTFSALSVKLGLPPDVNLKFTKN